MEGQNAAGGAPQGGAATLEDLKAELDLINEELIKKRQELADIQRAIDSEKETLKQAFSNYQAQDNLLKEVAAQVESKRTELSDVDKDLAEKKAALEATIAAANNNDIDDSVDVRFLIPAFRHNGIEYKSAELEKLASENDINALNVIADLIRMKSGVIEVTT